MARRTFQDLTAPLDGIKVISTDVFDTLLLRSNKSERSRIVEAEQLFARSLARRGWTIPADLLVQTRLQAQKLAFRALNIGGAGEVRIVDIIARQLKALGLPEAFASERLRAELQVEKSSLMANATLATVLRQQRSAGLRIIAISDTTLPADKVGELIAHCHGPGLVDRVYSSADQGKTKRRGDLFSEVMASEAVSPDQILHIGDDEAADVIAPSVYGIHTCHLPKSRLKRYASRADGAATEARRQLRRRARAIGPRPASQDAFVFGRDVLGPIVTHFCLMIWLYADQAKASGEARLLFCARGGIGIREAFERVLQKLGLPLAMPRDNLMVSRLVAARAAVLARSDAAVEELSREFDGSTFADVAEALGGRAYGLADDWQRPFDAKRLFALLFAESGREVLADIRTQNALFTRHLQQIAGDAERLILCDTGLYGSTQRLLTAGFPALAIEAIQFARANYKGHSEDHFPRVVGLLVEQNLYNPFKAETCVLRYWQLIESLFEPALPSVRLFHENEAGEVVANSGSIAHGALDPAAGNPLLTGALHYIDNLPDGGGAMALGDAEIAWQRLKQAITHPTEADVACLEVGGRSVDFGRPGEVRVLTAAERASLATRLASIKAQLWREGAIVREFPVARPALLTMLESVHVLRGCSAQLRR
jgi:FMN phosphatase YigB (HAD superfamily)